MIFFIRSFIRTVIFVTTYTKRLLLNHFSYLSYSSRLQFLHCLIKNNKERSNSDCGHNIATEDSCLRKMCRI